MSATTHHNNAGHKQFVEKFQGFYAKYYTNQGRDAVRDNRIGDLVQGYPLDEDCLTIDWGEDLFRHDNSLARDLMEHPSLLLPAAEEALHKIDIPVDMDGWTPRVEVINVDKEYKRRIGSFRKEDRDTLRLVSGIVSKQTIRRPKVGGGEAIFSCERCGWDNNVPQPDHVETLQKPYQCESCEKQGPFRLNMDETDLQLYQLIRIQKPPEDAQGGNGESLDIKLHDGLTDRVDVGERINALVHLRAVQDANDTDNPVLDWDAEAVGIERLETDWEELNVEEHEERIMEVANSDRTFELLTGSVMPSHIGDEDIKLALIHQLVGGVRKHHDDGSITRGDIHIFQIGDPSTGKTQFCKFACNVAPRSVFTSGKSSSAAGLTAACVRDDFGNGGFTIEGGVMVRAHKGIAGIDEVDKMPEEDQESLMEAMSTQQVSVSKGGKQATLPAQTRIIAAANPIPGRFDPYSPVGEQFDFHDALLSRFDLIFTISDQPDLEKDETIAEHVLNMAEVGGKKRAGKELSAGERATTEPTLSQEELRAYIAYAREIIPILSPDAKDELQEFYVDLRSEGVDDEAPVPISVRKLEGLVRLAEASARARLSERVESEDAQRAIQLTKSCMEDIGMDPETGEFDIDFIETGQGTRKRQDKKRVEDLVREMADEYNGPVPYDEIRETAITEFGIQEDKFRSLWEDLKEHGRVYQPPGVDGHKFTTS